MAAVTLYYRDPEALIAGPGSFTRPFFAQPDDWAYTVHDCMPTPEWHLR